jgi:hypothetical protein
VAQNDQKRGAGMILHRRDESVVFSACQALLVGFGGGTGGVLGGDPIRH